MPPFALRVVLFEDGSFALDSTASARCFRAQSCTTISRGLQREFSPASIVLSAHRSSLMRMSLFPKASGVNCSFSRQTNRGSWRSSNLSLPTISFTSKYALLPISYLQTLCRSSPSHKQENSSKGPSPKQHPEVTQETKTHST